MPRRRAPGARRPVIKSTNHIRARVELTAARHGWSLAEVARRMGVSPQTLQDILQRGRPRPETAERLAAALDMSVDDLLAEVKAAEYGAVFLPQMI